MLDHTVVHKSYLVLLPHPFTHPLAFDLLLHVAGRGGGQHGWRCCVTFCNRGYDGVEGTANPSRGAHVSPCLTWQRPKPQGCLLATAASRERVGQVCSYGSNAPRYGNMVS